jgi:hypothetical protein
MGRVGGGKGKDKNYVKARVSESNCQARTMTSGRQKSTVTSYDTIESSANVETIALECLNYI